MTSTTPLAFFVVDNRTDDILYFNHQFCEIWGISQLEERMKRGELKNNDIIPGCLPVLKDVPAFAESCKPLQSEFNEIMIEDEIPFMDGRTIRRFSAQIRGEHNEYYGRLYIFEDITQRKTTEQFIRIQRDLATQHSTLTSMSEALSLALEALLQIEGVDCGGIYLLDPVAGGLRLAVHMGLSDDFVKATSYYSPDDKQTLLVMKGAPAYISQKELMPISPSGKANEELVSLAVLPIQFEGVMIGCINLGSKTMPGYYEKIRFSLEAMAMQIGGTISRINAEVSLKQSQQNFQELFDTLDDFMFILSALVFIIKTTRLLKKRLGYTDEELNGMHVLAVHPPARREEAGFIVNEMLAGRALFCPVPLISKEGLQIPVETRVVMGKWDEKDVLFGTSRDITQRLKAEKELQLRESYLSAVINNHPGMFWMKDPAGKFLLVNDRNNAFLKRSKLGGMESVIGLTDFDFMPEEYAQRFFQEDEDVMTTLKPLVREEQTFLDNHEAWFEKYKFPVVDKNGEVLGVSAYSIDITERKKAEAALKMQSSAFESFAVPIIITDKEGKITWVNTAFLKLTGYILKEVLGETPGALVKSGVQSKDFYETMWNTINSGKVWSGELINRKKDGTQYPEEETITPVFDQENRISSFIAIKIDLTEKKVMERALRESEARWNFALEGSGDGVWDWDLVKGKVFFSSQWKRMLGYEEDEISNSLDEREKRVHPDDLDQCNENLRKHFRGETDVYISEQRVLCKDGRYRWILDRGKVVARKEDGSPMRVIGTHSDISDRKSYEEVLREGMEKEKELNRIKSKFISVASHEFRTPLATILATSESLISYRARMTEKQLDDRLGKIKDQVGNLNKIIEEVLNLSKLQTKERELEPTLFNLSDFTFKIVQEFREQTGMEEGIAFGSTPKSIEVMLDKKAIQHIVSNLLSNAVKYSSPDETIQVELNALKDEVILIVRDHGIGIPEQDLKHLYTPFFRASNSGNVSGTGLGLNIVKESVQRLGGNIAVDSILNEGTLFTIRLPRTIKTS
jgi:PAS domain S-box-containing protein